MIKSSSFIFLSLIAVFFLNGCGFQLNRNTLKLVEGAETLSIEEVINNTFVPGIDLKLKEYLLTQLNLNSIAVVASENADISLSFFIDSQQTNRSDYSLDDNDQIYVFQFSIKGKLSLFDNWKQGFILKEKQISETYSLRTENADLSAAELEEGRDKMIEKLANRIITNLSDQF